MIAHSLCAVPAHWAMVTQIHCAIVGDRVYSSPRLRMNVIVVENVQEPPPVEYK